MSCNWRSSQWVPCQLGARSTFIGKQRTSVARARESCATKSAREQVGRRYLDAFSRRALSPARLLFAKELYKRACRSLFQHGKLVTIKGIILLTRKVWRALAKVRKRGGSSRSGTSARRAEAKRGAALGFHALLCSSSRLPAHIRTRTKALYRQPSLLLSQRPTLAFDRYEMSASCDSKRNGQVHVDGTAVRSPAAIQLIRRAFNFVQRASLELASGACVMQCTELQLRGWPRANYY